MNFWKTKEGVVFDAYGDPYEAGGLSYSALTNRLRFNDGYAVYDVLVADGYSPADAFFTHTQIVLNSKLLATNFQDGGMILKRGISFGGDPIFGQVLFSGLPNALVVWDDTGNAGNGRWFIGKSDGYGLFVGNDAYGALLQTDDGYAITLGSTLNYPFGAGTGRVLTSDAFGNATWQPSVGAASSLQSTYEAGSTIDTSIFGSPVLITGGGVDNGVVLSVQSNASDTSARFLTNGSGYAAAFQVDGGVGKNILLSASGVTNVSISVPSGGGSYNLMLPLSLGAPGSALTDTLGDGVLAWTASGSPAIGGTLTGVTPGSVLFGGSSTNFAQDNANFFWDDTNNRLGIGTASPQAPLNLLGSATTMMRMESTSTASSLQLRSTGGVLSDWLFQADGSGVSAFRIYNLTTSLHYLSILQTSGNVGIGTTAPAAPLEVSAGAFEILRIRNNGFFTNQQAGIAFHASTSLAVAEIMSVLGNSQDLGYGSGLDGRINFNVRDNLTTAMNTKMSLNGRGSATINGNLVIAGGGIQYGSAPSSLTTVSGIHNTSVTTINVVSTTSYPPAGTLLIGAEAITYLGLTATAFLGCTRGSFGTTAISFAGGETVNVYLSIQKTTATVARVAVTATGNVGIGTMVPTSALHIVDSTTADSVTITHSAASGKGIDLNLTNASNSANALDISVAGAGTAIRALVSGAGTAIYATSADQAIMAETTSGGSSSSFVSFSSTGRHLKMYDTGGSNSITLRIPGSVTAHELTLPSANAAGALTNNGTGTLSWAAASGATWQVKTAAYTAVSGDLILADTSGGVFTITLPASPTLGQTVKVMDGAGTWGTNNLTVARNGSNINGSATDFVANISGAWAEFVYYNVAQGWRVRL